MTAPARTDLTHRPEPSPTLDELRAGMRFAVLTHADGRAVIVHGSHPDRTQPQFRVYEGRTLACEQGAVVVKGGERAVGATYLQQTVGDGRCDVTCDWDTVLAFVRRGGYP